ncbi:MAG: hypothetical protein AAF514_10325, partial [Verrucomicrobiota bacterium]
LENITQRLKKNLPDRFLMGEPAPAPLQRAVGLFRFQLMLRAPSVRALVRYINSVLKTLTFPDEVTVIVDVDPLHLS